MVDKTPPLLVVKTSFLVHSNGEMETFQLKFFAAITDCEMAKATASQIKTN
jgi:hypothetical protein